MVRLRSSVVTALITWGCAANSVSINVAMG